MEEWWKKPRLHPPSKKKPQGNNSLLLSIAQDFSKLKLMNGLLTTAAQDSDT
jgi:hypothetical protein